nr:hypothetical protein [Tanacetum cinerariifolium]
MTTVLTSMDVVTVLASCAAEVPTGSGSIPTAGPPAAKVPTGIDVVPTASSVFATATVVTPYKRRRKGKDVMTKKQKKDYYMAVIRSNLGWKVKDFRGLKFEEVEAKFTSVWKQVEDFIPMGSKEEAERFKRKRTRFEQEGAKKLKTSKEVPEEVKSPDEVSKEKIKEMMQLVPIEKVYIESLQVMLGIKCTRHSHCQERVPTGSISSHCQWKSLVRSFDLQKNKISSIAEEENDEEKLKLAMLLKRFTSAEGQNKHSTTAENGESTDSILSKPAVKFVKAGDRPAERPTTNKAEFVKAAERPTTDKVKPAKKPVVRYAEMYRRTSKRSTIRGNQRNWNNLKSY